MCTKLDMLIPFITLKCPRCYDIRDHYLESVDQKIFFCVNCRHEFVVTEECYVH